MNIIDIVLACLLIAAAIHGFIKGFFVELALVVALILGIWGAIEFSWVIREWLSGRIGWSPETIRLVAFILVFVVVVVVVHLAANIIEKFVKAIALGIFSRLAGAVFGALKGAFILSVLMLIIARFEDNRVHIVPQQMKRESKLYKPIEQFAPNVLPFLKPDPSKKEKGGKGLDLLT